MTLKMGYKALLARAEEKVKALSPSEVKEHLNSKGVLLVDIRDIREVEREGKIAGSVHVPRGMLEFWIDPESPYFKEFFKDAEDIVLHCNKGWRSALATYTLMEMGIENVCHMEGGFTQWAEDIGEVEKVK